MNGAQVAANVFRMLIYVTGVTGNVLVIFIVLFLKEYKKITHWYVLQMAVADIIFLQNIPVEVSEDINSWSHAEWLCNARQTVIFFTHYASILFLMIMALDRYLAVCHPMSETVERLRTIGNACFVSVAIWLISLALSIPAMIYSSAVGFKPNCECILLFPISIGASEWCLQKDYPDDVMEKCLQDIFPGVDRLGCIDFSDFSPLNPNSSGLQNNTDQFFGFGGSSDSSGDNEPERLNLPATTPHVGTEDVSLFNPTNGEANSTKNENSFQRSCFYQSDRAGFILFVYFNFIIMFLLPLLVLIVCYGMIVRRIINSHPGRTAAAASATTGRSDKEKNKVTIFCIVLTTVFALSWLPFHSVHMAKTVGIHTDDNNFCVQLTLGSTILAYLGSAINPYMYNFLGSFKKRFRQIKSLTGNQKIIRTVEIQKPTGVPRSGIPKSSFAQTSDKSKELETNSATRVEEDIIDHAGAMETENSPDIA